MTIFHVTRVCQRTSRGRRGRTSRPGPVRVPEGPAPAAPPRATRAGRREGAAGADPAVRSHLRALPGRPELSVSAGVGRKARHPTPLGTWPGRLERRSAEPEGICHRSGGGDRNRTCDHLLAKQELYQLSYAPSSEPWWACVDSNHGPYAYQAYALTT